MSQLPTTKVYDFPADDDGVNVNEILTLISGSVYYEEIYNALGVEAFKDKDIKIPGARTLVQAVDTESKRYLKFDVESKYQGLKFRYLDDEEGEAKNRIEIHFDKREKVDFLNPVSEEIKQLIEAAEIKAAPKYSSQSSFLESLYGMNKYAKDLANESLKPIVLQNFLMLEEAHKDESLNLKHVKWYRLLRDMRSGQYYFRALITDVYKDYNIGVSLFIALVSLYKLSLESGTSYSVKQFAYNESYTRVLFEEEASMQIPNLGTLNFSLELTNSELGDGAVKINGLYSITMERGEGEKEVRVYLQSRVKDKSSLVSISHKDRPTTAIQKMDLAANIGKVRSELVKDLTEVASKDPKRVQSRFRDKIKGSHTIAKGNKTLLYSILDKQVEDFYELLQMMEKAEDLMETEGYGLLEHLRYLAFYAFAEKP